MASPTPRHAPKPGAHRALDRSEEVTDRPSGWGRWRSLVGLPPLAVPPVPTVRRAETILRISHSGILDRATAEAPGAVPASAMAVIAVCTASRTANGC